ncbi:MAG: sigma 54-interacting transcriptional regulator, partial [Acidobacteriota bacterium]
MNPRLVGIAGPVEGAFYALPEQEVTIGSEVSNVLVINVSSVRPHHCAITGRGEQFRVRLLNGGGLFVNGLPVREQSLVHGDEIRIGECLFLYLVYESETPPQLRLERALERLRGGNGQPAATLSAGHDMIGQSPAMQAVYQFIAKVAPADSTVLIQGESGTGKELAARAIHRNSRRAGQPFVAINCAALAETLLESELFGHEKGSFTGAIAQKRGKLEAADGGTVFLDEVGEMSPALQAKLLRVLQEKEFERVGGTRSIRVDLRIIAATNRNLAEAARGGKFRQDLYYRLNVVSLTMPRLSERGEDIPLLAGRFVAQFAQRCGRLLLGISPDAQALLEDYDWPGNVRELENAIERAVVLGSSPLILPEDLPEALRRPQACAAAANGYHSAIHTARKQAVWDAVEQAGGDYQEAARRLGIHPNNLHRLIRTLDLRAELPRMSANKRK